MTRGGGGFDPRDRSENKYPPSKSSTPLVINYDRSLIIQILKVHCSIWLDMRLMHWVYIDVCVKNIYTCQAFIKGDRQIAFRWPVTILNLYLSIFNNNSYYGEIIKGIRMINCSLYTEKKESQNGYHRRAIWWSVTQFSMELYSSLQKRANFQGLSLREPVWLSFFLIV